MNHYQIDTDIGDKILMLRLKRNQYFNEFYKCKISNEVIYPGEWYYEDDEDGLIVKATVYKRILDDYNNKNFDYSKLNQLQSQEEYRQQLVKQMRAENYASLLDRKVYKP